VREQAWDSQHVSGVVAAAAAAMERWGQKAGAPLNLGPYHVNDFIGQTGNVLVAEVDGDAGLLLLQLARRRLGSSAEVAAGVLKGGFGQCHDLVVRNGRGRVVAHCWWGQRGEPGDAAAEKVADMLLAGGARRGQDTTRRDKAGQDRKGQGRTGQDRTGEDSGRVKYRMKSTVTQCVVRSTSDFFGLARRD
jgi:hypothetical protein